MAPLELIQHFHETTKHHPHRYARSLGYLDWATQPDPFRRFHGAPAIPLSLLTPAATPTYDDLFRPGVVTPRPVMKETISEFLQYSLALSAWKEFGGSRWALRINPSSGNLHPTEGYLIAGPIEHLTDSPGVFHYAPREHLLEQRCTLPPEDFAALTAAFPPGTFIAGLSSIHWREAWKYGERAFRYCQHDVGHALAALALSAAMQGWSVHALSSLSDADVSGLLGLDRPDDFAGAEREHPDLLVAVLPRPVANAPHDLPPGVIGAIRESVWHGTANQLSADRVEWEIIDRAAEAGEKPRTPHLHAATPSQSMDVKRRRSAPPARQIIFQRRSAVAMDGRTGITAEQFYLMLDRVMSRYDRPPWTGLGPPADVHLALFVHRVEELSPGLYWLARTPTPLDELRRAMRPEFAWKKPNGCPESLPLFHLLADDMRRLAGHVSCGQDIAADGAFSLGMIAEFDQPLREEGSWVYRRLFWETGMIGQVLYLEAEAAGIRSTGIGCFFDDVMHEALGLRGTSFQSLYHFTVGGPLEDRRLTSLPPYPNRSPESSGVAGRSVVEGNE